MGYRVRVVQEFMPKVGEAWTASHPELLGCHAVGRTSREACDELDKIRPRWIEGQLQRGAMFPVAPYDLRVDFIFARDKLREV